MQRLGALQEDWRVSDGDLELQPGIGKTRIIQEFFARLSATQPDPPFWPHRLVEKSDPLIDRRGRIVPEERFQWPAGVQPCYAWVGISCFFDEKAKLPSALIRAVEVIKTVDEPLWNRRLWMPRMLAALISILILVGGFVTASLGLAGVDWTIRGIEFGVVALVGVIVAVAALHELPKWLEDLRRVRQERRRVREQTVIDLAEALRDEARQAGGRMREFLRSLADDKLPAVVVVDDASWADPETLMLVEEVLRQDAPVLVLATVRPNRFQVEWEEGDLETFGGLVRRRLQLSTRQEELRPLSDDALAALVRDRGPLTDPALVDAVAAHAAGNPLVLLAGLDQRAFAKTLAEGAYRPEDPVGAVAALPKDHDGVFRGYWEQLPGELQEVVSIASFHGRLVQPDSLLVGCRTVMDGDPFPLIEQTRNPYRWLARVKEDDPSLDQFSDPAFLSAAENGRDDAVPVPDQRRARGDDQAPHRDAGTRSV